MLKYWERRSVDQSAAPQPSDDDELEDLLEKKKRVEDQLPQWGFILLLQEESHLEPAAPDLSLIGPAAAHSPVLQRLTESRGSQCSLICHEPQWSGDYQHKKVESQKVWDANLA
ncbi:hypothetical protein AWENTII_000121 [Aspergillus wentii]